MKPLELTKTRMVQGVWQGLVTGSGDIRPALEVTHRTKPVPGVTLEHAPDADHWRLSIPIPPVAIADGVQTLIVRDRMTDTAIGHVTLLAGDDLDGDIRAEVDLLRAELDMLKRAFRRHCLEIE